MENTNELVEKILVENGLDFTIEKQQLISIDGKQTPYFGLFNSKSGNCINTVKESYQISQNKDVVQLVVNGMQIFGDKLRVVKAGSLNDGRKVFLQLGIEGIAKVGNDVIERYVTVIDSNDGSTGLGVGIGNLTISCQNQFFKFYKAGQSKFRHTESLERRMREIPQLIEFALNQSMNIIETYNRFQSTPVSREMAHKMVRHILGVDKVTTSIKELTEMSTKAKNMMESLYTNIEGEMNEKGENIWGVFSGVTRWVTHEKSAPIRENGRLESMLTSTNYVTNQQAFEFCESLVIA